MSVCITYHEKFRQYDLGANHPFKGDRFPKAKAFFDKKNLSKSQNVCYIEPRPAKESNLIKVHTREFVDLIKRLAEAGRPYDLDTPVSMPILEALMFMIGGVIEAGDAIFSGRFGRAVALGGGFHHAGRDYAGGFCIFNDIAILVEHLREKFGVKRFLILDYDVHFGNGTSDIYYSDPNVLFISLHQDPLTIYPGRGFIDEIGEGEGEGYNVNVPLPVRTGEESYLLALNEIFPPLAEEFKPEIIIANGGSDAHFADHLGSMGLTAKGFFKISRTILETSKKVCNGRAALLIASGYNPLVLPYCWYALAAGFIEPQRDPEEIEDYFPSPRDPWQNRVQVERILGDLKKILRKYWKCF
ncbi:MAG: histone deacetylase family protein [Nitrososphaerota archaeon]|nr:histone deacetylase [Candidatus Bathyarchaeota archaeon]MDW8048914.1 histone deacetylase family protein [Nitrososphaerota archaeon]